MAACDKDCGKSCGFGNQMIADFLSRKIHFVC